MTALDFTPLFRSTIGFDRLTRLVDAATRADSATAYPSMAVAGFAPADLDVQVQDNALIVTGKASKEEDGTRYLHRGIARRAFERRFQLADTIKVVGASFDNGMLHVELVREIPEAMKPRTVKITAGSQPQTIEQKAA